MLELQRLSEFISGIHSINEESDQLSKLESQYEQEGFTILYKNKNDGMTNFILNNKSNNKNLQSLKQLIYNYQNDLKKQYKVNINYFQHSNKIFGLVRQFLFKFSINQTKKWKGILLYQFFLNIFKDFNQKLFANNYGIKISVDQVLSQQHQIITVKFQSWVMIDQWRFQIQENESLIERQFKTIDDEIKIICDSLRNFQTFIDEIEKFQQSPPRSDEQGIEIQNENFEYEIIKNIECVSYKEQTRKSENQLYFQYENTNDLHCLKNAQKIQKDDYIKFLQELNKCSIQNYFVQKLFPQYYYDRKVNNLFSAQYLNQSQSLSCFVEQKKEQIKIVLILLKCYLLHIILIEQNNNYVLFYDNIKVYENQYFKINLEEFNDFHCELKNNNFEVRIDLKKQFLKIYFRIFQILQYIMLNQNTDQNTKDILQQVHLKLFNILKIFLKNQRQNEIIKTRIEETIKLLKQIQKSNTILDQI